MYQMGWGWAEIPTGPPRRVVRKEKLQQRCPLRPSAAQLRREAISVRVVSKVHETRTVFRNRIIVVVDDDRSVSPLMAMMVAQNGHAAFEAEGGAEAIHLAGTNPIALLVTGIEMPGSGPELALMMKQRSD